MIVKEEYFTDNEGKKKREVYSNGIEVITLLEPSQEYIDKVLKPLQIEDEKIRQQEERERLVYEKMRELAIKELKKEGKL